MKNMKALIFVAALSGISQSAMAASPGGLRLNGLHLAAAGSGTSGLVRLSDFKLGTLSSSGGALPGLASLEGSLSQPLLNSVSTLVKPLSSPANTYLPIVLGIPPKLTSLIPIDTQAVSVVDGLFVKVTPVIDLIGPTAALLK